MGISLFCVSWLSLSVPRAGNAEGEEAFTLRANTESGFCQYLWPSPPSLLFVSLRPGPGVLVLCAGEHTEARIRGLGSVQLELLIPFCL